MVPADAGQVAQVLLRPVLGVGARGAAVVLEVAGPHHLEGLGAVEVDAGGGLDVEPRFGVEDRHRERHVDAAEGIHDVGELVEVERHRVLDRDPEVLLDGRHQLGQPLEQPGVDLVGAGAPGVGDEQVTGEGEEGQPVVGGIGVEDHDHVAVDPVHPLRAQPVGRVLHGEGAAGGRTHHQDVLRAGLLAGGEGTVQPLHLDAVEVVGEVVGVPGPPSDDQEEDDRADEHGQADPMPSLGLLGGPAPARPPVVRLLHGLAEGGQAGLVGHRLAVAAPRPPRPRVASGLASTFSLLPLHQVPEAVEAAGHRWGVG